MPRPQKSRNVCCLPKFKEFTPKHKEDKRLETVVLSVDEYEAIRLIDKEGFSQEKCGEYMNVARTTVQQIYTSARKKLADVLIDGKALSIHGGNYKLCYDNEKYCTCAGCRNHRVCPRAINNKEE